METCDRCIGTDELLDEVITILTPALQLAGYTVKYSKKEMKTAELAIQQRFLSSPTIRVNRKDICGAIKENSCGCCSEISGSDVACRVFEYKGETYEVPPKEMLAEAILRAVFAQAESDCPGNNNELPENLRAFFEGKKSASACSCGGCC